MSSIPHPTFRPRHILAAATCVLAVSGSAGAHAQQPTSAQTASQSGWSFNVAPYMWLPSVNTTLRYDLPARLAAKLPTEVSVGPGAYIPNLHFATMIAGEARYDRFSVLTDFIYSSMGTTADTHLKSLDVLGLPSVPISRSSQAGVSTSMQSSIWTLAGGYTVLQGAWGNLDVIGGLRMLNVNTTTNYGLTVAITGPQGSGVTLDRIGSVSGSHMVWNGIGGVRGRVTIGETAFFIPYYFDIGAGGSQLTWQIASGLGYQMSWGSVAATYRYLSFHQGSGLVNHMNLGGPQLGVTLSF